MVTHSTIEGPRIMHLTRRRLLATAFATAIARPATAKNVPELNLSRSGLALRGVDPVSYFTAGKPIKGRKDISLEHQGGTYRFATQANLETFKSNPTAYLPAYGGYCSYGTAVKNKVDGDPYVWHIVDGQLYLNINRSVDRIWQRNIPKYVRDADRNWRDLKYR